MAYPDGTGVLPRRLLTWNCGGLPVYAVEKNVDDSGFLRAMVADLVARFGIDRRRVFATGMSNGGMMAHRLAREAPDVFAAIADVAGAMNFTARDSHVPIPVLMIHGRDDQHVRYDGGRPCRAIGRAGDRQDASVADAVRYYTARNGCSAPPAVTASGAVERRRWSDGKAPVELISIEGEGHTWPGGRKGKYRGAATPTREFDASAEIWRFFAAVVPR